METATETNAQLIERIAELEADLERQIKVTRDQERRSYDLEKSIKTIVDDNTFIFEKWTEYENGAGQYQEFKVIIDLRISKTAWFKTKKTRIFTSGTFLDVIADEVQEYYEPYGEEKPEYKEGRRRYRKAERAAIEFAFGELGIEFEKMSHSRTAGCSCGCSQGWVVNSGDADAKEVQYHGLRIEDIFVEVQLPKEKYAFNAERAGAK